MVKEKNFIKDFQDGSHILYFQSEGFNLILIYKSPWYFLRSFQSVGLSVQEKMFKNDLQHDHYGNHLGFTIGTILAVLFCFVFFYLKVTPILSVKFWVNLPLGSGEIQYSYRFSRWQLWYPSWIKDWYNLSYFGSTSHPNTSYQISSQFAFQLRRRNAKRFSRWQPWWSALISDKNQLSYFDLQLAPILPTKFQIHWYFGSGEEAQTDFRWPPSWISNRNNPSFFYQQVTPILRTKIRVSWPFRSIRSAK